MNNTPMTRERLDAIQERVDKTTIGPWVRWEGWDDTDSSVSSDGREDAPTVADVIPEKADAEFITHAREDVPALLAEVERLRALTKDMARAWQEGWNTCKRASTLIDWGTERPTPNPYREQEEA